MLRNLWQVPALLVVFLCPAMAQKQGLTYRPVGAEYSSALDRIIMIGGNPNALYLYDAANNITDTVTLSAAPMSLSISPDGLFAAALHSNSVSYVNLSTKSVSRVYTLPAGTSALSGQSVVLAKDWIYLPPSVSINISSGIVTGSLNSNYRVYSARLHPNGKAIYLQDQNLDVSGGALPTVTYCCDYNTNGIWFSRDATRVYTSGGVTAASDDAKVDRTYYTYFPDITVLRGFTESASKGIAVIDDESVSYPFTNETPIRLYNSYLSATGVLRLPDVTIGAKSFKNYGRWVFFNNAGTTLYVVMQADSASGLLNDYSVETYNVGNPAPCLATFGTSTSSVGGFGALGSVDLTAGGDCIYQASSSASWLQIVSGGYGSGNTTLTYVARPNTGGARSANITIGGQTLTVSQDAAVALGSLNRLSVGVTAAEYNKTSDKIVYVSTLPNELHIYDPTTGGDTAVPLAREPLSVSVRPDGAYAAVGHLGWISNVNLSTGTVDNIYKVSIGLHDLISAGNGYMYLFPAGVPTVYSYEIATGLMTATTGFSSGGPARLHPMGKSVYAGNAVLTQWSIEAGVASRISSDDCRCGNFWIAESGDHIITSGSAVRRSSVSLDFLQPSGSLSEAPATIWAAQSTAQSAIAAIPTNTYNSVIPNLRSEVRVYNDPDLSLRSREELPKFTVSGTPYTGYGRYVFWNRSATQLYVIQEADSTARLQSGFGVAPVSPMTCNFTLARASDSGTYSGFSGQVDVTVAPLCLWTPILNADNSNTNWIRLTSNSAGAVGTASLGYTVAANPSPASRQATIVLQGQTFTITQAGNPGTLTVSPSTVTVPKEGASGYLTITASNNFLGWSTSGPSSANWVGINQAGRGSVQIFYNISANPIGQPARTATITINDQSVTFNQAASTGAVAYAGSLDSTNCQTVSGWAADRSRLNLSISVSIYDNSTLLTTMVANQSRPDVGASLGDNGLHGFTYTLPASVRGGNAHSIHVVYETNYSSELYGSPKTLTCTSGYTGSVDGASCSGITGWAADSNRLNTSIVVSLWEGYSQVTSTTASLSRPDVGAYLGDNGLHGFKLLLPAAYTNGFGYHFEVRYELSPTQVYGSPVTLTCNSTYVGYIDSASCTGISGWAADRSMLGRPISVFLRDGNNRQIAAADATNSRPDVGAALGDQGSHGFTLLLPTSIADGVSHTLQVYYEGSTTRLGSPVTLTCGGLPAPNYAGYVDTASCSGITGWAADKNRLNAPILVSLWDGSTPIASMIANGVRSDVGASVGDNGAHGFSLAVPAAYANGVSHSLQVRYETSASQLPGSPATLTCGSTGNYTGSVDVLSCSSISGWAADRNSLNSSINVNVYDGSTLLLTLPANGSRSDVGAYLGDNGLHAFGGAIPASIKDGKAHTITVRPGNSTSPLYGQQSLTCP